MSGSAGGAVTGGPPSDRVRPGVGAAFVGLVRRDLMLAARDSGSAGTVLGFYLIVVAMTPLGLGPDPQLLARIAPGILWIGLLLAALLATARLFEGDAEDGSLDVLALSGLPLEGVALAKMIVHWLTIALPLVVVAPLLGLMLNLDIRAFGALVAAMLLGTPAVSAIGTIGAALTLRARKGGLLVALLVLPLYIPTLIFGISAVSATVDGMPGGGTAPLLILAAISLGAVVLSVWAAGAALATQLR